MSAAKPLTAADVRALVERVDAARSGLDALTEQGLTDELQAELQDAWSQVEGLALAMLNHAYGWPRNKRNG